MARKATVTTLLLCACAAPAPVPPRNPAPPPAPVAADPAVPDAGTPESDPPATDGPGLAALRGRLKTMLDLGEDAPLALPSTWPSTDRTLLFYVYRAEPLPTGRVTERVEGPVSVTRMRVDDGSVDSEDIRTLPLVVQREVAPDRQLPARRRAEAALLEVVAGRSEAEASREALRDDYCSLLDDGALGADLRKRAADFVEWLSCPAFGQGGGGVRIQTAK